VEAPPGTIGKYSATDGAWGGCSLACAPGGVNVCKCDNGVPLKGADCKKHGAAGCQSCDSRYEMNADKTACVPLPVKPCVTNGDGDLTKGPNKGQKVPAGTPCTGYWQGKGGRFCQGTGYAGRGWCGVEAAPGTKGKYSATDGAWGGCSLDCIPGGK